MVRGMIYALMANLLFGVTYYFSILLRPLSGESMFALRIIVLIPVIFFAVFLFKQQNQFKALCQKLTQQPFLIIVLLLLALNTGVQLWLFLWAANHGQGIPLSVGYLLLPLMAVFFGKVVFKERFSRLKWLALFFAIIGVAYNIFAGGAISWVTFVAGIGYPAYFTVRRYFKINHLPTFIIELILVLPFALYYLAQIDFNAVLTVNHNLYFYLFLLGLVSGSAFILFISANNLLPMNILGLLGYLEPLVMLLISLFIGEQLDTKSYLLLGCLLISISLLTLDSFSPNKG